MTIPSTPRKTGPFTGTGVSASFPFTFKVFAPTEILVTVADLSGVEYVLTYNTDYSVTLNANQDTSPGGTVVCTLPVNWRMTLTGNVPYDQPLDLPSGGRFSDTALENQLDRATMQIQQLREGVDRAVRLPVTTTNVGTTLPTPAPNMLLGWNADGTAIINTDGVTVDPAVVFSQWHYESFTGNGVFTTFPLTHPPADIAGTHVSVDGLTLAPLSDYNVSGTSLLLTSAPSNGAEVLVRYGLVASQEPVDRQVYRFIAAAGQTVVSVAGGYPSNRNAIAVYVNGLRMENGGVDFTETNDTTLTFNTALAAGDSIVCVVGSDAVGGAVTVGWTDVTGKPSTFPPTTHAHVVGDVAGAQPTLVSGTNIKTINGSSLLGSGNLVISGSGSSTFLNVKSAPYNAVGDGVTDDTAAIQAAINAANATGDTVFFPPGIYIVSGTLTIDNGTDTAAFAPKASLLGSGASNAIIWGATGNYNLLTITGGVSGAGMHSHQYVKNLSLFKDGGTGACLNMTNVAYFDAEGLHIRGGEIGISASDFLSATFRACQVLWCSTGGVRMERSSTADGFQSGPNAVMFDSCVLGNNGTYGGWFLDGGNINFIGGSVEGNGVSVSNGFGLQFTNMGLESGAAANISGTYFEHNKGVADLWINATSRSSASCVTGATFNRISSSQFVTNNILVESANSGTMLTLAVNGCGFKKFGSYTASSSRRTIAQSASSNAINRIGWSGCYFSDEATDGPLLRNFTSDLHAFGVLTTVGSLAAASRSMNISGVQKLGTGIWRVDYAQRSESTNPCVAVTPFAEGFAWVQSADATFAEVRFKNTAGTLTDTVLNFSVHG